jgi:hypothetical protein
LYDRCGKMVRSNLSIASTVVCEVWGLALSCCSKMFFLCLWTLLNHCFKVFSCNVALWVDGGPRFKEKLEALLFIQCTYYLHLWYAVDICSPNTMNWNETYVLIKTNVTQRKCPLCTYLKPSINIRSQGLKS